MDFETIFKVKTHTKEAYNDLLELWKEVSDNRIETTDEENFCFDAWELYIEDVMRNIVKINNKVDDFKDKYTITGKSEGDDGVAWIFEISCGEGDAVIKAKSQSADYDDEEYYGLLDMEYEEISEYLKKYRAFTFKEIINEEFERFYEGDEEDIDYGDLYFLTTYRCDGYEDWLSRCQ